MAGEGHHVLTADDVRALDRRARKVGDVIGWDLQFVVAPNAEYVGLRPAAALITLIRSSSSTPAGSPISPSTR